MSLKQEAGNHAQEAEAGSKEWSSNARSKSLKQKPGARDRNRVQEVRSGSRKCMSADRLQKKIEKIEK